MRLRRAAHVLPLLLSAAAPLGCVTNPATGRPELVLMSEEQERAAGRQAAAQVQQEMGTVDDPGVSAYVDALGRRLAAASTRPNEAYTFQVVDMPEPNAFALPGGHVYVSRGLLAIANSEDELANVIGHEIGHVAARHAATRQTQAMGVGLLSVLGAVAAGVLGGADAAQAVGQLGQVAGAGLIASYSREQEREADLLGQRFSAASGFDPAAMASFLRTLESETRLDAGAARRPSFFDSHPATPERVENAARTAATLREVPAPPIAADRAAFLGRIRGILLGANPAEGVVRGATFLHPDLDFAMRFPDSWTIRNSRAALGASEPNGRALVVVETQGPGEDPKRAAAEFVQRNGLRVAESGALTVGGCSAFRVLAAVPTQGGEIAGDVTWIAHGGTIYRVIGMTSLRDARAAAPDFARTVASFRPLSAAERESISERRLDFAAARAGESLAAFSARTGNVWSLQETAVANALPAEAPLAAGQLVKIARQQPYRSPGASR